MLVVDDEQGINELQKRRIQNIGITTLVEHNGQGSKGVEDTLLLL